MTKADVLRKLNGHVHLTWKQLAVFGSLVVLPWAMTITVAVAIATHTNNEQQKTLDSRSGAVERLSVVETDVRWVKKSQRRIEQRIFGNSVIPPDDEEEGE